MSGKQLILVLGMSRAGTSAITRVLSLCGLLLPEDLAAANYANPTGFWESNSAISMNELFLRKHGSSWCDPTLRLQMSSDCVDEESSDRFIDEIGTFLDACPHEKPLVVKDPRIATISSYWFEAARRKGFEVKVVLPIRHPFEVAASLAKRDGAAFELSCILWLKANLLSERASRSLPRVVVAYADLLVDWRTQTARVARLLDLDLSRPDPAAIEAFLDPGLYTHRQTELTSDEMTLPLATMVYDILLRAAHGEPLDAGNLDRAYADLSTWDRFIGTARIDSDRLTKTLGLYGGTAVS